MTESSRGDENLINGDGGYHSDAGTGYAPAQDVGPRRIDVAVVLEWLVVPQPVADDALYGSRDRRERDERGCRKSSTI